MGNSEGGNPVVVFFFFFKVPQGTKTLELWCVPVSASAMDALAPEDLPAFSQGRLHGPGKTGGEIASSLLQKPGSKWQFLGLSQMGMCAHVCVKERETSRYIHT